MYGTLTNSLVYVAAHFAAAIGLAVYADLFGLELAIVVGVCLAAWKLKRFGEGFFERVEALGSRFAERRIAAPVALAAAVIVLRAAIIPIHPIPHPIIADEFSHLLLADTFSHGRLSNPSHAAWPSFETLHVIQQPTYASMYFPGPALLLWLGTVVTGVPWFGLLIATGALCGLVCWALQAWVPARWALLGGTLVALRIGIVSYWVDSYWGGTFAAIGGTLVLGALPRLLKKKSLDAGSIGLSLLMALGIGILANSRPYEGVMFSIPVGVRLAGWLFEKREALFPSLTLSRKIWRVLVPMAVCLAVMCAGMGIYFNAVTGSPTRLPYVVNQERFGWPMTLPWTDVKYVKHDRREFADYYMYEMGERLYFTSLTQFLAGTLSKLQMDWRFYVGPALTIPCLFIGRIYRNQRLRFLMVTGAVVILAAYFEPHFPHYMAPALIPIAAVLVQGYRYLRQGTGDNKQLGLRLSRAIPLVLVATVGLRVAATPLHLPYQRYGGYTSWCCSNPGSVDHEAVARRLPPGRHLLLVRYHGNHPWVQEWVFNGADIDGSRVVWARELGGEADRKLLAYFKDRQAWILEPDLDPPRLMPYRPSGQDRLAAAAGGITEHK